MRDYSLSLFTGIDIPLEDCGLILHQPTIKEISLIGETNFLAGIQLLVITKEQLAQGIPEEQLNNLNIFSVVLSILQEDKEKKQNILDIFQLIFQGAKVIFTPRSINFMLENNNTIVDENNFLQFQEHLRKIFCIHQEKNDFNVQTAKAKEIAQKLYRARQRVAAQKKNENQATLVSYLSSLVIAVPSMSLQDTVNLTLYQLYDLLERYGLHTNWDLYVKCQLAGGDPQKEQENWMKNIH